MSTVHDTTKLKPYVPSNPPQIEDGLAGFVNNELNLIASSLNTTITALKAIEARIVAGGL